MQGGTTLEEARTYDKASRVLTDESYTYTGSGGLTAQMTYVTSTYDADGNLFNQLTSVGSQYSTFVYYGDATSNNSGSFRFYDPYTQQYDTVSWTQGAWGPGYDPSGNLRGYVEEFFPGSSLSVRYSLDGPDQLPQGRDLSGNRRERQQQRHRGARERPDNLHLRHRQQPGRLPRHSKDGQ